MLQVISTLKKTGSRSRLHDSTEALGYEKEKRKHNEKGKKVMYDDDDDDGGVSKKERRRNKKRNCFSSFRSRQGQGASKGMREMLMNEEQHRDDEEVDRIVCRFQSDDHVERKKKLQNPSMSLIFHMQKAGFSSQFWHDCFT